ncbi:hypothetical protein LTR91_005936 [Friedmanniomyces endolithicus]|uniref:Uncharacterized protein n=1 Tax=Friedmanniomyces endolithicus TaxID=329885 RepID=A0AAN6KRV3_9PEZI|nr:hypothetical protein LTR94_006702 [Friedmanniomyces endolithicus]KAK0808735.1 hypothetical protein LTR59_002888 [Friedmanniomyces endolithicus]KAK0813032.1 hypothetical protein LTR38_003107 [Friedmanniomyces endolithicus]KAK0819976.1 hypothetical protein LTR75_001746 [Friedmanniomyces endolithicus]KAK0844067.1 hypothetical protein LTR03_008250 [Friedmanniomyces endolithicus]
MDAPSVTRGEFLYRDTLFVDVGGEGKRHPRAAETELKALLSGKTQQKDQVAHWYEAQLIHYGLQRSKDKNTAKVRLQQALSQGKLKIPSHISDMETQMKKDYAAAVRKAKKADAGKVVDDISPRPTKKRKMDDVVAESSKRSKISLNFGGIAIDIEHDGHGQAKATPVKTAKPTVAKAPKKMPASRLNRAADTNAASKPAKTTKPKAALKQQPIDSASTDLSAAKSKISASASMPVPKPVAATVKAETKPKAPPKVKAENKVRPEPKVKAESKVKAERKVKPEPSIKSESVKRERHIKPEYAPDPMDMYSFPQR